MDKRRRTLNDIISTIFLLNVGTVPTVWYIFFHFIIYYEKKTAELQLLKKIWLWSSSVIKIVKMRYNRIDIKWRHVSTSFKLPWNAFLLLHHVHDILLQNYFTQG